MAILRYVRVIANDLSLETKIDFRVNAHQILMVDVPLMICS